jgi:magnesium chelatase family protein
MANCDFDFPLRRIVANLAPASLRKAGPGMDLALATALLVASGQLSWEALPRLAMVGELALDGSVRPVAGALAIAEAAREQGADAVVVPAENGPEAAMAEGIDVIALESLEQLPALAKGEWAPERPEPLPLLLSPNGHGPDLADLRGQRHLRYALEVAAAGGHSLLMIGPPGAGKTMLARRLPGILPPPTFEEALEVTQMHSAAGIGNGKLATERPFRAPHHTISAQGLVGGGNRPMPGEITLAHRGVLFLDELPEFGRAAVDALRQPLEEGYVEIMRGQRALEFPANAMVVAACNRCPCARGTDSCSCTSVELARYRRRLSGPLLDRIDLVCQVDQVPALQLVGSERQAPPPSAEIRERVMRARERQQARLSGTGALCNGDMDGRLTRRKVQLDAALTAGVLAARDRLNLSGRGHDRVLRVARTIADLDGREHLRDTDLDEALSYRLEDGEALAA